MKHPAVIRTFKKFGMATSMGLQQCAAMGTSVVERFDLPIFLVDKQNGRFAQMGRLEIPWIGQLGNMGNGVPDWS